MVQGQLQVKRSTSSVSSSSTQSFPLEIVQLLNVLARIEARRQSKLRASQKVVS